jgi:hypothetical protein
MAASVIQTQLFRTEMRRQQRPTILMALWCRQARAKPRRVKVPRSLMLEMASRVVATDPPAIRERLTMRARLAMEHLTLDRPSQSRTQSWNRVLIGPQTAPQPQVKRETAAAVMQSTLAPQVFRTEMS